MQYCISKQETSIQIMPDERSNEGAGDGSGGLPYSGGGANPGGNARGGRGGPGGTEGGGNVPGPGGSQPTGKWSDGGNGPHTGLRPTAYGCINQSEEDFLDRLTRDSGASRSTVALETRVAAEED